MTDLLFRRIPFSQKRAGGTIQLTQNASPGDLIHVCEAGNSDEFDEIYLWVANGGTGSSNDDVYLDFGGSGNFSRIRIDDGSQYMLAIGGTSLFAGRSVRMYSTATSDIFVIGHVNAGRRRG